MKVGSLFSGIGGIDLGLERAGFEIAYQVENDENCRGWLQAHWPGVPKYGDIKDLDPDDLPHTDIITGGFPCQPWSLAGKRRGKNDDRDLWPEMLRIIAAKRPRWVLGENVPGLDDKRFMALDGVCADLEALGYETRALEIPACAVNAPHKRSRLWIIAHSECQRCDKGRPSESGQKGGGAQPSYASSGTLGNGGGQGQQELERGKANAGGAGGGTPVGASGAVGDLPGINDLPEIEPNQAVRPGRNRPTSRPRRPSESLGESKRLRESQPQRGQLDKRRRAFNPMQSGPSGAWDEVEWMLCGDQKYRRIKPGVCLLAHGIPGRVAKIKALGNAVVPQVVEMIGRAIMQASNED